MKKPFIITCFLAAGLLPASAQLPAAYQARLQFVLDSVCSRYHIKGASAAVLVPNAGTWKGAYGESYPGQPITTDMVFGIASDSKPRVATVMLKLQEKGLVNINDSIGTWIKHPYVSGQITIKQLLNHTSGINDPLEHQEWVDSVAADVYRIWEPEENLKFLRAPDFAPGTSWRYSNINYILAGIIIKQIMSQPYSVTLREELLDPAGLDHTYFYPEEDPADPMPHVWSQAVTRSYQQDMMAMYNYSHKAMFSLGYTAGSIMTTAEDNVKFWHKLISGQLMQQASLNQMKEYVQVGQGVEYGLGIYRLHNALNGRTVYEHGGTELGFVCEDAVDEISGVSISVLTNQDSIKNNILFLKVVGALHKVTLQLSPATSTESIQGATYPIRVYPNPASAWLQLDMQAISEPVAVELLDMTGKEVLSGEIQDPTDRISLADIAPGLYLARIKTPDGRVLSTQRVIKTNP